MYSLLTEELNNYNNLGKNEKNTIDKKTDLINDKIEKKMINSEYNKNEKSENSLNIHIFNPLKNSPPSNWQFRLLNRINSLNDLESINE